MSEMTVSAWQLAQVNVLRPLAPITSPKLAEFVAQLAEINALADAAPGFVWRLPPAGDGAGDVQVPSDPELLVNLTVWRSVEDLFDFTFRTAHTKVMMRRREWFERPAAATLALWWVPEGEIPTVEGAMTRLAHLRAHGPTPHTFTFKQRYPVPPEVGPPVDMKPEPYCAM